MDDFVDPFDSKAQAPVAKQKTESSGFVDPFDNKKTEAKPENKSLVKKGLDLASDLNHNMISAADVVSGAVPFLAQGLTAAGLSVYNSLTGDSKPIEHARSKSAEMYAPFYNGYSKIAQLFANDPSHTEENKTAVDKAMAKFQEVLYKGPEYLQQKTGNKELGEAGKAIVDLLPFATESMGKAVVSSLKDHVIKPDMPAETVRRESLGYGKEVKSADDLIKNLKDLDKSKPLEFTKPEKPVDDNGIPLTLSKPEDFGVVHDKGLDFTQQMAEKGSAKVEEASKKHQANIESAQRAKIMEDIDKAKVQYQGLPISKADAFDLMEKQKKWDAEADLSKQELHSSDLFVPEQGSPNIVKSGTSRSSLKNLKGQRGAVDPQVFIEAGQKAFKAGEDLTTRAKEIFDKYGEDAARIFINNYHQEQQMRSIEASPKSMVEGVEHTIRTRINNIMSIDRDIHNKSMSITKIIPEIARREKISIALDKGSFDGLDTFERSQAERARKLFDDIGNRAKDSGVLEGLKENYISHIVDWSKVEKTSVQELMDKLLNAGAGFESTSPKSRFGKERKYNTFEALEEAIKDSGLEVKTKDVAEIYKIYARSMERAMENKKMIEGLKSIRTKNDIPILQPIASEGIPNGWKTIKNAQMRAYAVHPEIEPHLKFIFDNHQPGAIFKAVHNLSQAVKRINVVGSLFHANSLVQALWSAQGLKAALKEILTGFGGTRKALSEFHNGGLGDRVDAALKNGLVLEVPEDVAVGIIQSIGKVGDDVISKYGPKTHALEKTGKAINAVALDPFNKITWDFLHTGLKLNTYLQRLEKAKIDHPEMDEAKLGLEIARSVNDSFGGLNWYDVATQSNTKLGKEIAMAAMSPEGRRGLQILLFAPDWTLSTLRTFTNAFKNITKGEVLSGLRKPKDISDYARRYQLNTALTYLTVMNGVNMAQSGHFIWKNEDPTRIDMGDGTSIQPSKHGMEPYHWLLNPDKTLANKLGFVPGAAASYLGGLAYLSLNAPKLQDQSMLGRTKAVLNKIVPFQVSSARDQPTLEEKEKRFLMSTLGVPVYGKTNAQRAQARAEKRKAVQEQKKAYRKHLADLKAKQSKDVETVRKIKELKKLLGE